MPALWSTVGGVRKAVLCLLLSGIWLSVNSIGSVVSNGTASAASVVSRDLPPEAEATPKQETPAASSDTDYKLFYPQPMPISNETNEMGTIILQPSFGKHRQNKDAIFTFFRGFLQQQEAYKLRDIMIFLTSLIKTGYDGDIVVGVDPQEVESVREYLSFHVEKHNLILYEMNLDCVRPTISHLRCTALDHLYAVDGIPVSDPRVHRHFNMMRFEYYHAWAQRYSDDKSRIFLLDARDVVFQANPFLQLPENMLPTTLIAFAESTTIRTEPYNSRWIKRAYGRQWLTKLKDYQVLCAGSTVGGKPAIDMYTRAMIAQFDLLGNKCSVWGCDQGFHNWLISANMLQGAPNITSVEIQTQGDGIVNTLGVLAREKGPLRDLGIFKANRILNNDGISLSPIYHQYDRDQDVLKYVDKFLYRLYLAEWKRMKT